MNLSRELCADGNHIIGVSVNELIQIEDEEPEEYVTFNHCPICGAELHELEVQPGLWRSSLVLTIGSENPEPVFLRKQAD